MKFQNMDRIEGVKIDLKSSVPNILKNLILGIVILIYGRLVFIPFGQGIKIFNIASVSTAVSALLAGALFLILLNLVKHISIVSGALSIAIVLLVGSGLPSEMEEQEIQLLKKLIYVFIISLILIFLYPLLPGVFKSLASFLIFVLVLWVFVVVASAGDILAHGVRALKSKVKERLHSR
jgi:hypothetical protein